MRHVHALSLVFLAACQPAPTPVGDVGPISELPEDVGGETVAHRLLRLEQFYTRSCQGHESEQWWANRVDALDTLLAGIDEALDAQQLPADPEDWSPEQVEQAFTTIDHTLYGQGYIVCVDTPLLGDTFGPFLGAGATSMPSQITRADGRPCHTRNGTDHRFATASARLDTGFRPFDCDMGSHIYMSVAERHGWPMSWVRIPSHIFVRWHFPDGRTMNWDVNEATSHADDDYRSMRKYQLAMPDTADEQARQGFFEDLDEQDMTAFYLTWLIGKTDGAACTLELVDHMVELDTPLWPESSNAAAWLLSTDPELRHPARLDAAQRIIDRTVELRPRCAYWDTKSCVHAARGEFDEAVAIEIEHVSPDSPRIPYFQAGMDCFEPIVADEGGCRKRDRQDLAVAE